MSLLRRAVLALVLTALPAASSYAGQWVLVLDPAASKVSFVLDATTHDVEGTLALKPSRIAFDSATGAASGEISIDLKSAATGNKTRDHTMHEKVLETGTWPLAVFRAEKLRGAVAPAGVSQVTLDGTLSFHGADHKLSLPAKVEAGDGRLKAETELSIPYVEWGLYDPSVMFLRVEKVVTVKVQAEGRLEGAGAEPEAVK
jgi:polyisoprenoid-binding protein YceI